jgi:hypothetical protein
MTIHEDNVLAVLRSLLPKHRAAAAAYPDQARADNRGECFADDVTFPGVAPSKETDG